MLYFNGFSLKDENHFFQNFLKESDYTVVGFSYGAIKAVEYAIKSSNRIDTLQLFSPAFFQSKPEKFKRLQLMGYKKDSDSYINSFIKSSFSPYGIQEVNLKKSSVDELKELLYYIWDEEAIKKLVDRGIRIEVYLGSEDKIIDAIKAKEFFLPYATTYMINHANHFLQGDII